MRAKDFLTKEESKAVVDAIKKAEYRTSGEIRVHIDNKCSSDPKEKALRTFHMLNMGETAAKNAVLIYVACESRKFAVLGDKGINNKVPSDFWKDVCQLMGTHFSQGRNAQALIDAVALVGEKLKDFFPYMEDDVNELSDEISIGEDEEDQ